MKIFSKVLKKFFERRKLGKVSIFNDFCFFPLEYYSDKLDVTLS